MSDVFYICDRTACESCNPNCNHNPVNLGMCPDYFDYLDEPENCNALHDHSEFAVLMSCEECWKREVPKRLDALTQEQLEEIAKKMTREYIVAAPELRQILKNMEEKKYGI